jgi:hypothetical protein
MTDMDITLKNGDHAMIAQADIDALGGKIRGDVLRADMDGYDEARHIWNGMVDRHPAMIVRCAGTSDIISAVNFARDHDLLLAVRGGGHNVAGNAVCEGGLMIDLSAMNGVHVNAETHRARVQGGATWGDFDAETQIFGLATTGGLISATGVAGLTLGGGIGWLSPSYGLACDNLCSVDVVTASGEYITASADQNSDLFWGLKGGGGNFGVAASFEFDLHQVGPEVFAGTVFYPIEDARETLVHFRDFMAKSPDELGAIAIFTTSPDGNPVLALAAMYNGDVSAGEAALQPLRSFGKPFLDTFEITTYCKFQTLFDAGAPSGMRYYWKSGFLNELPDEAIVAVIEQMKSRTSVNSKIFVEFLSGELARIPPGDAVFDHRLSPYNLLIIGSWRDEEHDEKNRVWARGTLDAMSAHASSRVYVNYLGTEDDEGGNRIRDAYGPGKYEKLLALKKKYDPENLFRMNQNIRPV